MRRCLNFSTNMNELLVKAGSISLITPGPEEQLIPVMEIQLNPTYDAVTGLDNIALLQVKYFFKRISRKIL